MQIMIDIPKHIYEWVTTDKRAYSILNTGHMVIIDAIKNATPLGETGKDINAPTTDCISRAEAQTELMASNKLQSEGDEVFIKVPDAVDVLRNLPSVAPATVWHKIKTRPLTDEEKEAYWEEYTFMYDCEMPDDEQEVLIKTKWGIEKTTYHTDDGCYFEDYEDEGAVIAWTELPEWEE